MKDHGTLTAAAIEAREKSYSPYSGFATGAALLCENGKIYTGTNVESASYGVTVCAERVALFKAVADGERSFRSIAVVGGRAGEKISGYCPPCGACRQALAEFCSDDMKIILTDGKEEKVISLGELLPLRFDKDNL